MFLNDILDKISDMRNGKSNEDDNTFIDPATGNAVTVDDDPIAAKLYDESYDPDEELNENSEEKTSKLSSITEHLPSISLSDKVKKRIPLIILIIIIIGYLGMNLSKFTDTADSVKEEVVQVQEEKEAQENEPDYVESINSQGENQKAYEDTVEQEINYP